MLSSLLALAVLAGGPLVTFAYDNNNPGAAPSDDWELVYEHKIPKQAGKNDAGGSGWTERSDIPYRQHNCESMEDEAANSDFFTKVAYVRVSSLPLPASCSFQSLLEARASFELFPLHHSLPPRAYCGLGILYVDSVFLGGSLFTTTYSSLVSNAPSFSLVLFANYIGKKGMN